MTIGYTSVLALVLGTKIIIQGFMLRKKLVTEQSRRDRLSGSSWYIPGFVQMTLMGMRLSGLIMLLSYFSCFAIEVLLFSGTINAGSIGNTVGICAYVYPMVFIIAIPVVSTIQIADFCNSEDMAFINGEFEMNVKDTRKLFRITGIITALVCAFLAFLISLV